MLLLVRGLARDWLATREWSPEIWSARFGDRRVSAFIDLPGTGITFPRDQDAYRHELTLGEFLVRMQTAPADRPCYLAYQRLEGMLPELAGDFDFAPLAGKRPGEETDTRLWVGSCGTRSMLHSDLKPNVFVQLYGRKQVWLVPFDETHLVYPFPDNIVNSRIDLDAVDPAQFPRFRAAHVTGAVLEPGDVLFMPRGVWHYFRSLDPFISLNHWVGDGVTSREYLRILMRLGPQYWIQTCRDFTYHGVLGRPYRTLFFFSPPPTGKRLYDLLRHGNFSRDNDPAATTRRPRPGTLQ